MATTSQPYGILVRMLFDVDSNIEQLNKVVKLKFYSKWNKPYNLRKLSFLLGFENGR